MRHHYVSLLFFAGVFFKSAMANSTSTDSTLSTAASVDSPTAGKYNAPVQQYLKTIVTADEDDKDVEQSATHKDDKERGFSFDSLQIADGLKLPWKSLQQTAKSVTNNVLLHAFLEMKADETLLKRKEFIEWYGVMKKNHPKDFNKKAVSTLSKYHKADALYEILDAWKGGSTKVIATELQNVLVESWLVNKKRPDIVYNYMKVHDKSFNSPTYVAWAKYLAKFNEANRHDRMTEAVAIMKSYGSDKGSLYDKLRMAMKVEATKEKATELWMRVQLETMGITFNGKRGIKFAWSY